MLPFPSRHASVLLSSPGRIFAVALAAAVALAIAPGAAAAGRTAKPKETEANKHHDRGVELAHEGAYAAAVVELERAYELEGRFPVLLDLGRAYAALDKPVDAAQTLKRYLALGGTHVPPARRKDVNAEIARQEQRAASAGHGASSADTKFERLAAAGSGPAAPGGAASGAVPAAAPPPTSSPPAAAVAGAPATATATATAGGAPATTPPGVALAPSPAPPPPKPHGKGRLVTGFVLTGLGVVTSGVAGYHFIWNKQRYDRWAATDLDLSSAQSRSLPDFQTRQQANNDLASAISRASRVTLALAATGGALLITGVVLVLTAPTASGETATAPPAAATHALNVGLGYVEWRGTF